MRLGVYEWTLLTQIAGCGAAMVSFPVVAAAAPLLREDNNRSQFAGQDLKRVGAFGQEPTGGGSEQMDGSSSSPGAFQERFAPESDGNRSSRSYVRGSAARELGFRSPQQSEGPLKRVPVQSVFLNGENIIGLRNQVLKGVNVRFDAHGNIFIDAPHYQLSYEATYHPLLPEELPALQKERGLPPPSGAADEQ